MPNTKSAVRRVRRVKKQTIVNRIRKSKYKNEIIELKATILAEKRILKSKFNITFFKKIDLKEVSSLKKKLFIIFSFIPLFPRIIYKLKNFLFKLKWL